MRNGEAARLIDIVNYQLAFFHLMILLKSGNKNQESVFQIYFSLLKSETKDDSKNSNFALVDSVIRCGLKVSFSPILYLSNIFMVPLQG